MRLTKVSYRVLIALLAMMLLAALPGGVALAADGDGDGVPDNVDRCISPPAGTCADADLDNITDDKDNCPKAYNVDQKNSYGGAEGDACEAESGQRLNGYAEKIVAYQFGSSEVHFYLPTSQKLGAVLIQALQNLATAGGSLTVTGEGGNTLQITYNGKGEFRVTHVNSGNSATFALSTALLTAPQPTAATTTTTATTASRTYTVQRGDTLTKIARRFGVTVNALVTANNLRNPNALSIGQTLVIP